MDILKEAERLHSLGWACHWIKPNSKAPVKSGWSGPIRDEWDVVRKDYQKGYGLGVRLGESSKLGDGGYLANIDVDIKSSDPKHKVEALSVLESKFPGLLKIAPVVKTGHGLRLFVKTKAPNKSGKLAASHEECIVKLPTAEINKRQLAAVKEGKLTEAQLKEGYRVRAAWELEFMSVGKQVVLPPSIHPETKLPYIWQRSLDNTPVPDVHVNGHLKEDSFERPASSKTAQHFEPVVVKLKGSKLPDSYVNMILTGEGVDDRSTAIFTIAKVMLKSGFSKQEIASVLTDKDYELGNTSFKHAQTNIRARAAAWVLKYTIPRAEYQTNPARAFEVVADELPPLDEKAAKKQFDDLIGKDKPDWRTGLKRTQKGALKESMQNVVLILENAVGPNLFRRDLFANRDFYGINAPWNGVKGEALTDDDAIKIKHWLAQKFNLEPSVSIIFEAMVLIANRNGFHPVRNELEALPIWDGVGRVDGWLKKHFHAKGSDEYLAQVFRKWLVASIARTFEPGLKFDWMPILQGHQGTGKSSFGAILFGQKYFTDWLPVLSDKDAALGLQGIRCVEFGELDQLRRNELETTKAFVTRRIDKVRPPYGRRSLEIHRQCVFFGTTNRDEYLKDDTGNRRFNPVEVGRLNFGVLARERDQLWAEALFIYQNGLEPSLYLEGEAETFAIQIQKDKMVSDESAFMEEALRKFIGEEKIKLENERFNFNKFKLMSLFNDMGPLSKQPQNGRSIQFASKALKNLGAISWQISGLTWWKLNL